MGQGSLEEWSQKPYQKCMDQAIIDLQIKLTEAERVIQDLSDVVSDQANRLERAEKRIEMLMQRAAEEEANSANSVALGDQKPPHW